LAGSRAWSAQPETPEIRGDKKASPGKRNQTCVEDEFPNQDYASCYNPHNQRPVVASCTAAQRSDGHREACDHEQKQIPGFGK
jgi:hypothetical protein